MNDEFMAEIDMNTLRAARDIESNPKRLQAAKSAAKRKAEELMAFANDGEAPEMQMVRDGFRKVG